MTQPTDTSGNEGGRRFHRTFWATTVDVGKQLCYRTSGDHIVFFTVTALVEAGGLLTSPQYELNVVVWSR